MKSLKLKPVRMPLVCSGNRIAPYKGIFMTQQSIGENRKPSGEKGCESIVAEGEYEDWKPMELIYHHKGKFAGKAVNALILGSVLSCLSMRAQDVTAYVNPFIGTTNFGTCNPGAVVPNGMMSVVPFNVMGSDDNTYDKDARWWSTPLRQYQLFFHGLRSWSTEWCRLSGNGLDTYYRDFGRVGCELPELWQPLFR